MSQMLRPYGVGVARQGDCVWSIYRTPRQIMITMHIFLSTETVGDAPHRGRARMEPASLVSFGEKHACIPMEYTQHYARRFDRCLTPLMLSMQASGECARCDQFSSGRVSILPRVYMCELALFRSCYLPTQAHGARERVLVRRIYLRRHLHVTVQCVFLLALI